MNFRPCVTGRSLEYKLNRTGARKAVMLGSSTTGVIAHVHPETLVSKQQTHQSGEPIWLAFTWFVKKTGVTRRPSLLIESDT